MMSTGKFSLEIVFQVVLSPIHVELEMFEAYFDNESNTTKGTKMLRKKCTTRSLNQILQTVVHFNPSKKHPKVLFPLSFPTRQSIARGSRSSCRGKGLSESIRKTRFVRTWGYGKTRPPMTDDVPREMTWMIKLLIQIGKDTISWIKVVRFLENSKRGTLIYTSSSAWMMRCSQPWIDETCIKAYR